MTSKFQISRPASTAEPQPTSADEFVNGASLVRSQLPERAPKPVRLSTDLTPDVYERMKRRSAELRLTGSQYIRALILKDLQDRILK
jgi:hypothetical protein